ncbi:MAG: shikimate dehydrogenase [Pseudomonadota bacterium]
MSDRYAVIGNPVRHSLSPGIHAAFARETGEDIVYNRLLGDMEDFNGDVRDFFRQGGCGLNVTVPFKEKAWELVDVLSERAQIAGAVNTITLLDNGKLQGDNTDGVGLVRDLTQNHGFAIKAASLLLIGAGGASRGVILPLLQQQPASLVIANRTAEKAVLLAERFSGRGEISGCGLHEIGDRQFDLIINATAAGLKGDVPAIPDTCLAAGGWSYDMMYGREPTAFVRWGERHHAGKALDGIGMLVEQAAESFYIWRCVRPHTAAVIQQLASR